MGSNAELAEMFGRMADVMQLVGENAFKAIAFQRVSRVLEETGVDIVAAGKSGELPPMEGIGESSRRIIIEYAQTGKSRDYEQLIASVPAGVLEMLRIPGLGPKTVALLWKECGIESVDALEQAIGQGKLAGLKGVGAKKIAAMLDGIRLLKAGMQRRGFVVVAPLVDEMLEMLRSDRRVGQAEAAGSFRRRRETVGDVDLLCWVHKPEDAQPVIETFCTQKGVEKVNASGRTKGSILVDKGFQIDLRIVPKENFGAALLYFTGSKEHNVKLRGLAQEQGMTLNEWGLYRVDQYDKAEKKPGEPPTIKPVAGADEKGVYAALGLDFIEPEMREERGEIEAAATSRGKVTGDRAPGVVSDRERRVWIERNFRYWRTKYLGDVMPRFAYVATPDLSGDELSLVELAVALEHPDGEPRHAMPCKRGKAHLLPRFNAWDPRYEKIAGSSDPDEIRLRVRRAIAGNARLAKAVDECRTDAQSDDEHWTMAPMDNSTRGLRLPDVRGIYLFRNAATQRVNEGYVGQASSIRDRLGHHFRDAYTAADPGACGDNLILRYADEEAYVAGRGEMASGTPATLRSSRLPLLVTREDIRGELHCHTTASDGHASIEQMAEAAKAMGYEYIAITDHSVSSVIANGLAPERLKAHIKAIRKAQDRVKGIHILAGSEVDILTDGSLDYEDALLAELDVVIASPHVSLKQDTAKATDRLLRAIESRYVHIIGHPTGRMINQREGLPLDMPKVIATAAQAKTALEINAGWPRWDLNDLNARAAAKAGVMISVNTDAHAIEGLRDIVMGLWVARRAWLTPQQIVNCMPYVRLAAWLKAKR